jgi:thiamine-monophosphate kinase
MSTSQHSVLSEEREIIELLTAGFERHPQQLNDLFTSDAEVLDIGESRCLVSTTDTLSEEIRLGILRDPWKIGWTAVNVNLSDLAAVGADALGLLLSWGVPPHASRELLAAVARGVLDALRYHHSYLLGGDLNEAESLQLCGTALGLIEKGRRLQRAGMCPGDALFLSGPIGSGNALGCARILNHGDADRIESEYLPTARLRVGRMIAPFASSCIDTSDGVLAGLDLLAHLNRCGVVFRSVPDLYDGNARRLSEQLRIPLWLFAAAEHGEFELLFSVPEARVTELRRHCELYSLKILELGHAIAETEIVLEDVNGSHHTLDAAELHSISSCGRSNPSLYVERLIEYARSLRRS